MPEQYYTSLFAPRVPRVPVGKFLKELDEHIPIVETILDRIYDLFGKDIAEWLFTPGRFTFIDLVQILVFGGLSIAGFSLVRATNPDENREAWIAGAGLLLIGIVPGFFVVLPQLIGDLTYQQACPQELPQELCLSGPPIPGLPTTNLLPPSTNSSPPTTWSPSPSSSPSP